MEWEDEDLNIFDALDAIGLEAIVFDFDRDSPENDSAENEQDETD